MVPPQQQIVHVRPEDTRWLNTEPCSSKLIMKESKLKKHSFEQKKKHKKKSWGPTGD